MAVANEKPNAYDDVVSAKSHWESIYGQKEPAARSWFRPHLDASLRLIQQAVPDQSAAILDVGSGESTLPEDLIRSGYRRVVALDISWTALRVARQRCTSDTGSILSVCADARRLPIAPGSFDLWHDRAMFHFLTDAADRRAYAEQILHVVRPGGHVIISTFGIAGPEKCSGLTVTRYDAASLQAELGARFHLVESFEEIHLTPLGAPQQFVFCHFRVA